jgi:tetratricopeptide (TPR) repeat protein
MDEPTRGVDDREGAYELLVRGQALMRDRHFAQAAVVLARAAHAEPDKGSILEALGRAYFNSGQHDRSRETFERLLEVDPSSPYGHFALGQSLKRLGRRAEARTHLRIAVALDPHSQLYRGALERLGPAPKPAADPGNVPGQPRSIVPEPTSEPSPEPARERRTGPEPEPEPEPPAS